MKFNIREIREDDLSEIARWFSSRQWPMPAVHNVGPKIGAIASVGNTAYACIYTYMTGTSVAYLDWSATNPDVPIDQSMEAFDELLKHFKKMCELSEPKVRVLCMVTQSKALSNRLSKHGFNIKEDFYKATWTLKE
jgi:hypothetical protein